MAKRKDENEENGKMKRKLYEKELHKLLSFFRNVGMCFTVNMQPQMDA